MASIQLGAEVVEGIGSLTINHADLSVVDVEAGKTVATEVTGSGVTTTVVTASTALTVAITSQVLVQDTGASTSDRVTSNGGVKLAGTVSPNAGTTVQVYDGTTLLGLATLSSTGTWSYATTLVAGTHALHAVATDLAGNITTTPAQPTITVDTTAPTLAITSQVLVQDTGASTSDRVTSNGGVKLAGTVSPNAGTTVQVYDGTTLLGLATLSSTGTWSYATTLVAGTHALHAVATDLAGNATTTPAQPTITVDTTAPTLAITSQVLVQDTGASTSDRVTSNGGVKLAGTVSPNAGTTVQVYDGTTLLGLATLSSTGTWSYATTLVAGTHALHAVATDLAGNATTTPAQPTITVDTTAPTLAITSQVLVQDTGASTSDRVTSNGGVKLAGTVSPNAGTTVQVYDGTTLLGLATLSSTGTWSYATTLVAGTHALHAVATDLAGNATTTPAQPTITVDTTAPTLAITSQVLVQDTGASTSDRVTSNGGVKLAGTVSPNAGTTVQVYDGTTLLGLATPSSTGTWSYATTLVAGTHALHAVATDLAGNITTTPAQPTITVDTTAPTLAITSQVLVQDTGASTSDRVTSNGGVKLAGTVSPNAGTTVQVYDGTTLLGLATPSSTGTWSYATTLVAGTHALHAVATDLAGNITTTPAQPTITVDTTAPTLAITSQVLVQDTGASTSDRVTSNGGVKLAGTVSPNAGTTVQVYDGTTLLGLATLSSTGTWSYATTLVAGTHALHAVATDLAGNATTTPLPTNDILDLQVSEDAWLGNAQFTVSIDGNQVGGVRTATVAHSSGGYQDIQLVGYWGAGVHTAAITFINDAWGGTATTDRNLYVNGIIYDGQAALSSTAELSSNGTQTFVIGTATTVTNAASFQLVENAYSTAAQPTITVDTKAPTVAVTSQILAQDTGVSSTDRVTSNGSITLAGTVSVYAGTTVEVYDGTTLLGLALLSGTGTWSYATILGAGTHALHAVATDLAGNTTTTAAQPTITVAAPPVVTITSQVLAQDTGASASDLLTQNGKVTLTGTASTGSGIKVQVYDGTKALGFATLSSTGTWSFTTTLGSGAHALHAVATDLAGNTMATAAQQTITVDTMAPTVAITSQVLVQDTGTSSTDRITSNGSIKLAGTVSADVGTTVQVYDGTTLLGLAALSGTGTWSYTTTLGAGTHALHAVATDLAGNTTTTAAQPTITVAAPPVVTITSQVLVQDTGASAGDLLTQNGKVTLTGSASMGSGIKVQIYDGTQALGFATLSSTGTWSYTTTLGSGAHALHAVATDLAGNTTATAAQPTITVDTTAPTVAITSQILAQDTGANSIDRVTSNGSIKLAGTVSADVGTTVQVYDGTTLLGLAALGSTGTWSYTTTLGAGTHALHAVATDLAGNTTTTMAQPAITVDTTAPTVTITSQTLAQDTGASSTDLVTSNGSITLAGMVSTDTGTTVQIYDGTTLLGLAALSGTGTWSYATTLAAGTHTLDAMATDLAGNTTITAAQSTVNVTLNDTTNAASTAFPLGAYVGNPDNSNTSNEATFDAAFSGLTSLMGTAPEFLDTFIDYRQSVSSWASNSAWAASSFAQSPNASGTTPVIGLPMYSTAAGSMTPDQQFQAFAAGTYDNVLKSIVGSWAQQGFTDLVFRPGWEMNLQGTPYYVGDDAKSQADWVSAFQHIYTVLHQTAAADGINVQVVWNPGTTNYSNAEATTNLYPGNQYVDAIGADVYGGMYPYSDTTTGAQTFHDWDTGGEDTSIAQFMADPINREHYWSDPAATKWSNDSSGGHSQSLESLIAFAKDQGKPFAVPETGAGDSNSGHDVTDDAAFPRWLASELSSAQTGGVPISFVNIWDSNGGGNYAFTGTSSDKPQEAAAWSQYFGAQITASSVSNSSINFIDGTGSSVNLTATSGTDQFDLTSYTAGIHTISGFDPTQDTILLNASSFANFAAVQANEVPDQGGTLIHLSSTATVVIQGITPDQLGSGNITIR